MHRVMMSSWMLFAPLVAQAPAVNGLLDTDWKVRNETARTLAGMPAEQVDVDGLLRVLRAEWDGELPEFGIFGGRGGRYGSYREPEPRERIRVETTFEMNAGGRWWHRGEPILPDLEALVVPWHPRTLAAWLIEHRVAAGAKPELTLPLDDDRLARAWLWLAAPAPDRVRQALAAPLTGRHVAEALRGLGRVEALDEALQHGGPEARRHVFAVLGWTPLDQDRRLAAAAELVLRDDDSEAVENLAAVVEKEGSRGLTALVEAFATADDDEVALARLLVILCRSAHAPVGHAIALAHIDDPDETCRHRSLYLLGKGDIPTALSTDAAVRLLRIVTNRTDRDTRLLAFDALGRCGAGVTAAQRTQLLAMLQDPPAQGTKARVLGCLRQLGAAGEVPFETRGYVATTIYPTTATWLALADEGARGADTLAALLAELAPGIDRPAVADRLAVTAPEVLRAWLLGDQRDLQPLALTALRQLAPDDGITTEQLLTLLESNPALGSQLVARLDERNVLGNDAARVFTWMAAQGLEYTPDSWRSFAANHRLPTARMVELLDPLLRRGHAWDLLGDDTGPELRAACLEMLAATEHAAVRARLTAVLARSGAATPAELDAVLAGLHAEDPDPVLSALGHAARLPPEVRARVEELLTHEASYTRYLAHHALRPARRP